MANAAKIGEGIPQSYKEQARKGCDVLFCVKIKGRSMLVDDIPLHMSLKIFGNPKEFDLEELKRYVKKHDICSPDPKDLTYKPIIFTAEKSGIDYYMLKIEGLDPKYEALYNHYKHVGNVYKNFMTHVTIDKVLYDDLKEKGIKPEDIEFGPLELEHGSSNTVHTFEKSERLQKSYADVSANRGTMQLTPNEIETIEDAGMLNNSVVKLIKTKGGFWIAVGRPLGKLQEEALAAGSHPAIVKYNLERQHPTFQPALTKSELLSSPTKVEKHSRFLSEELIKSGHDLFSIQTNDHIEFQVTKQNAKLASAFGSIENGVLVLRDMDIGRQYVKALAGATAEKAISCGAQRIRIQGK